MSAVYFDHNATTPLDSRVREVLERTMAEVTGNPSSVHRFGQTAREVVEAARESVSALVAAQPEDLLFCASGTEANNAVIFSQAQAAGLRGHLVISALEHPSVLAAASRLEAQGMEVTRVPPSTTGRIDPEAMTAALRPETFLVCLMLANNEVGTTQPVAELASFCRQRGVPLLCDAVQAVGKMPVAVEALQVDYLSLGAHKFYGPLGAAALWVRPGAAFEPHLVGGGQERRRRAGTENVPALAGFGRAAELAGEELTERRQHMELLRSRFEDGVRALGEVEFHGAGVPRLPNTSNLAFHGVDAEALMIRLDLEGFAISTGSACASGVVEASSTLIAMGISTAEALSSVRVSFGLGNSAAEVDAFLDLLSREVPVLRSRGGTRST